MHTCMQTHAQKQFQEFKLGQFKNIVNWMDSYNYNKILLINYGETKGYHLWKSMNFTCIIRSGYTYTYIQYCHQIHYQLTVIIHYDSCDIVRSSTYNYITTR